MQYLYLAISIVVAGAACGLLACTRKLRRGTLIGLLINSVAGIAVLAILTLTKTVILPLNPFNAVLTGILGVPGVLVVFLFARFL